jgi:hypothetical protein
MWTDGPRLVTPKSLDKLGTVSLSNGPKADADVASAGSARTGTSVEPETGVRMRTKGWFCPIARSACLCWKLMDTTPDPIPDYNSVLRSKTF